MVLKGASFLFFKRGPPSAEILAPTNFQKLPSGLFLLSFGTSWLARIFLAGARPNPTPRELGSLILWFDFGGPLLSLACSGFFTLVS